MSSPADTVMRAITEDGAFRVIAVRSTDTVRGAIEAQAATGPTARLFADLVTGTVLIRETMSPSLRVQGILKGAGGRGSLVVDSRPGGATRGLLQIRDGGFRLGAGSRLQMMRSLVNGALHQGIVDVSDTGGITEALMVYMQESEQVVSVIAVGAIPPEGDIARAGGYIVQLLPEAPRSSHMIMTERLAELPPMDTFLSAETFSPHGMIEEILYGMPFAVLEETPIRFECGCSMTAVLSSLATLGHGDVSDLVSSSDVLDIRCDYCGKEYQVEPERLRALVDAS